MPATSISLSDKRYAFIRHQAQQANIKVSRYVSNLIDRAMNETKASTAEPEPCVRCNETPAFRGLDRCWNCEQEVKAKLEELGLIGDGEEE